MGTSEREENFIRQAWLDNTSVLKVMQNSVYFFHSLDAVRRRDSPMLITLKSTFPECISLGPYLFRSDFPWATKSAFDIVYVSAPFTAISIIAAASSSTMM